MPSCSVSPKNLIWFPIWTFGYFVVVVRLNNISKDLPVLLSRNLESFSLSGQWTWPSFLSSTDATNWPSSKLYWSSHKYKYTNIQIQKYMTQFSIQQNCNKLAICRTVLIMTRFHFQSWWFPKLWLAWCDSSKNSPFFAVIQLFLSDFKSTIEWLITCTPATSLLLIWLCMRTCQSMIWS